jgi:hypothetical protein
LVSGKTQLLTWPVMVLSVVTRSARLPTG